MGNLSGQRSRLTGGGGAQPAGGALAPFSCKTRNRSAVSLYLWIQSAVRWSVRITESLPDALRSAALWEMEYFVEFLTG